MIVVYDSGVKYPQVRDGVSYRRIGGITYRTVRHIVRSDESERNGYNILIRGGEP